MLKKLQTISWGGWSAILGVLLFAGLAVYPLAAARLGAAPEAHGKLKKDGLAAMIDKVSEKSAKAKMPKDESPHKASDLRLLEPKALATLPDGGLLVGTKHGLYRQHEDGFVHVPGLTGDVKSLALAPDGAVLVGTKMGVYRVAADATVTALYSGEVQSIAVHGERLYLGAKHEGVLVSADAGRTWQSLGLALPAEPAKEMKSAKEKGKSSSEDAPTTLASARR